MRAAEGKLPLANTMRQLDASDSNACTSEGLEPQHRSGAPFDRAMVLRDDVIEITASPHYHALPPWIFFDQQAQCQMARGVAVQIDLARPRPCLA